MIKKISRKEFWNGKSYESVYIRIQMKVINTYHLYWEPTFCKGNQISIMKGSYSEYKNPIFVLISKNI